jgi:hypothetical protein
VPQWGRGGHLTTLQCAQINSWRKPCRKPVIMLGDRHQTNTIQKLSKHQSYDSLSLSSLS